MVYFVIVLLRELLCVLAKKIIYRWCSSIIMLVPVKRIYYILEQQEGWSGLILRK